MINTRGPLQDFLDAVKEAKKNDQQFVVHVHTFTNLFDGTPMGVKLPEAPKTIDTEYAEAETKLLK